MRDALNMKTFKRWKNEKRNKDHKQPKKNSYKQILKNVCGGSNYVWQ